MSAYRKPAQMPLAIDDALPSDHTCAHGRLAARHGCASCGDPGVDEDDPRLRSEEAVRAKMPNSDGGVEAGVAQRSTQAPEDVPENHVERPMAKEHRPSRPVVAGSSPAPSLDTTTGENACRCGLYVGACPLHDDHYNTERH